MPKVSVIVPAYNAELYINECVDSLVAQTLEDIEIILIDDGSTDGTGKIIDQFERKHSQIKSYHQENKGLYKTREIAVEYINGEYIGWVDADDFVAPTMFEELYDAAKKNESDLVYCNYQFYPHKIKTKDKWYRPYLGKRDTTFVERNSQPWNKIVRTEFFLNSGAVAKFTTCFDEIYIKILLTAKNPICIDRELYTYRMGPLSMSSSYTNILHYEQFIRASTALKVEMKDYWKNSDYWKAYFEYREIYYIIQTMLVAANAGDKSNYKRIKEELKNYPYNYHRNRHTASILKENFGHLKAVALEWFVPSYYSVARLMCKVAFTR